MILPGRMSFLGGWSLILMCVTAAERMIEARPSQNISE